MDHRGFLVGLAAIVLLAGCATTATAPVRSSTTATQPSSSTSAPTTTSLVSPGTGHKVLVVMEENHSASEALGQMPTLARYASQYGRAAQYFAIGHPSLPNYVAIWSGSTQGIASDCDPGPGCAPLGPTVWSQTLAAGETAKAYQEAMTSNCQAASAGTYAAKHGPWAYFSDPADVAGCNTNDVPLGTTSGGNLLADVQQGHLPVTGEITPDVDDDAHNGSLAQADAWLAAWLPLIMAGPDFRSGHLTIIVTFDEDDSSEGNQVPFVVIDPRLSHAVVNGTFNHFSLTRWLDENAGVSLLRSASSSPDLKAAFGL